MLFRFNDLRLEVSVRLDDNDGIVHAYLSFFFLKHKNNNKLILIVMSFSIAVYIRNI
jgi:hypothetical protein